jgi:hypothetical protein
VVSSDCPLACSSSNCCYCTSVVSSDCPLACSTSNWQLSAILTDCVKGTGIICISLYQGNGTLNTSRAVGLRSKNVTRLDYSFTCCSKKVELVVVDRSGNVGVCLGLVKDSVGVVVSSTAQGLVSQKHLKSKSIISTIGSYFSQMNLALKCYWETGPRSLSPTLQLYL